ncbi:SDR family NAD(P)-dependent oxidoreductase [Ktedonospora formicarum]|uniref:Short-chain dehydrogenase n=1 Tax=Ktedonospora formicarum TaxID=2778364 RepID=A0A8J3I526_9CHLR|nr:SDR family oxidoreductase [Ktedonospora formicarum]GHO46815.1 short-chain dehydrogenase [Ktedonospora formicarum]
MFHYAGKTALITGASSGIGETFARELAVRGMHLILVARSEAPLRTLATELAETYNIRSEVIVADLSQPEAIAKVQDTVQTFGLHVGLLVNNAGFGTYDNFDALDPARDHQQVMLNVTAVVDLTHAFLPQMAARGEGAILNVASMAAFIPTPYMAVYAASKAFVLSFSESLWAEYRQRGIQVLALCPGQVETAFHAKTENPVPDVGVKVTPREVVVSGLKALEQGKRYVIPGRMNHFSIQMARLMSRSFLLKATESKLRERLESVGKH